MSVKNAGPVISPAQDRDGRERLCRIRHMAVLALLSTMSLKTSRAMKNAKKDRLEAAGWKVGSAEDFLSLSDADRALIDVRILLAKTLRKQRVLQHLSQTSLAERVGSSQSRVAKMEAGDPSVTLDLLVRTLFATGTSGADIAAAFTTAAPSRVKARKSA